ncbi:MAG: pyridoxine 5'-phosphate synthase [Deltaproteobacteria bacterium]|nr:pyridoxine 5'-phosphate synthase [Deltaproteobacteria bacterium]
MARLAVNIDHIATIREARKTDVPDPVLAAGIAEMAGAECIICHLREDRRHINDRDLALLRKVIKTRLNMEMAAVDEMVKIAGDIRPDMVTLVPEKRQELTTEGGLDVKADPGHYAKVVERLAGKGIRVSFFVDPDPSQIEAAHKAGADIVEIHTGHYSNAVTEQEEEERFQRIALAVEASADMKLGISAGHGLDYWNINRFRFLPRIQEYSIGHSIMARAIIVGLDRAVRDMIGLIKGF